MMNFGSFGLCRSVLVYADPSSSLIYMVKLGGKYVQLIGFYIIKHFIASMSVP